MECVVCFSAIEEARGAVSLGCNCKATFCLSCVLTWLKSSRTCPTCRREVERVENGVNSAETFHTEALGKLAAAQASGFHDKQSLKDCSRFLIDSLVLDPTFLPAYSAMGYLLVLLGDNEQALRYLNYCVEIAPPREEGQEDGPSVADAKNLIEFILSQESAQEEPVVS